jgi:hypothetical protein
VSPPIGKCVVIVSCIGRAFSRRSEIVRSVRRRAARSERRYRGGGVLPRGLGLGLLPDTELMVRSGENCPFSGSLTAPERDSHAAAVHERDENGLIFTHLHGSDNLRN